MPQRIAARLVTGPLAFLAGGVIDVLSYAGTALAARIRSRWTRRRGTVESDRETP